MVEAVCECSVWRNCPTRMLVVCECGTARLHCQSTMHELGHHYCLLVEYPLMSVACVTGLLVQWHR
jgi:hypothetical protein